MVINEHSLIDRKSMTVTCRIIRTQVKSWNLDIELREQCEDPIAWKENLHLLNTGNESKSCHSINNWFLSTYFLAHEFDHRTVLCSRLRLKWSKYFAAQILSQLSLCRNGKSISAFFFGLFRNNTLLKFDLTFPMECLINQLAWGRWHFSRITV